MISRCPASHSLPNGFRRAAFLFNGGFYHGQKTAIPFITSHDAHGEAATGRAGEGDGRYGRAARR